MSWTHEIQRLGGEGILTPHDLSELNTGVRKVYELMRDGGWYTRDDIEYASGQREGMRRMRELRQWFEIERQRVGNRDYVYRLRCRVRPGEQAELFGRAA